MGAGYDLFESEASVFEPVHRRIRSGRLLKPLASFLLLGVIYASMMKMVCRSEMARGKRKKAANLDMRQWSGCNSVDEPMGNATLDSPGEQGDQYDGDNSGKSILGPAEGGGRCMGVDAPDYFGDLLEPAP